MLRTVEKYEILSEIGHGGMASVYRARDTRLDRLVALKVLHPHLRGSAEARVRFTREARSVAKLNHPNVLEIYDYSGEGSEESYIAAELLTGPTLKDYVASGRDIPAEVAACFGVQIARALAAAHAKGIVHRDVKPENVLLHESRLVKLTDFGIAHMIDAAQGFTATGQVLGSPGHMAPEQVEGGECDERTDVFALGTVLYFLATARLPFSGKNPPQILRRVIDCEYPDPLRLRPSIGGALCAVIVRAMSKAPSDRFASAAELEAALVAFLETSGVHDADACLVEYLADPEAKAAALRAEVVPRLVALGADAAARGDVPCALEHWNRVLALDEGNEEVLRRIGALGRAEGRRRALRVAARSTVAASIAGLVLYVGMSIRPESRVEAVVPPPVDPVQGATSAAHAAVGEAPEATLAAPDAGPTSPALPVGRLPLEGEETPRRSHRDPHAEPRAVASGPRLVVFQPNPQNVLIGVDGAPPRPFGPSFRSVELAPGRHSFRFVAGTECCEDSELSMEIPPGEGPLVIRRALPLNAARLYVVSNVPADIRVEVAGTRPVAGRARDLLSVPVQRLEQGATYVVTAPGHRPHTGQVRLRAGEIARTQVDLQPEGTPP